MRRILPLLAVLLLALAGWASADTTAEVLERGELLCGVSADLSLGEPVLLVNGGFAGFYAGFCRAVAAALLGDANAVVFLPVSTVRRFEDRSKTGCE